jgi:hypothetical protein
MASSVKKASPIFCVSDVGFGDDYTSDGCTSDGRIGDTWGGSALELKVNADVSAVNFYLHHR